MLYDYTTHIPIHDEINLSNEYNNTLMMLSIEHSHDDYLAGFSILTFKIWRTTMELIFVELMENLYLDTIARY
jgi:hypothetical protein